MSSLNPTGKMLVLIATVTYRSRVHFQHVIIKVSASAKWMLQDADGNQKGCFQVPVVIKSPTKKPEYTPEAQAPKKASQPVEEETV